MGRGVPPARVRDTLVTTFLGLAVVSAAALAITGTEGAVPQSSSLALMVPLCAAGQLAGRPLFRAWHTAGATSACSPRARHHVAAGLLTALL